MSAGRFAQLQNIPSLARIMTAPSGMTGSGGDAYDDDDYDDEQMAQLLRTPPPPSLPALAQSMSAVPPTIQASPHPHSAGFVGQSLQPYPQQRQQPYRSPAFTDARAGYASLPQSPGTPLTSPSQYPYAPIGSGGYTSGGSGGGGGGYPSTMPSKPGGGEGLSGLFAAGVLAVGGLAYYSMRGDQKDNKTNARPDRRRAAQSETRRRRNSRNGNRASSEEEEEEEEHEELPYEGSGSRRGRGHTDGHSIRRDTHPGRRGRDRDVPQNRQPASHDTRRQDGEEYPNAEEEEGEEDGKYNEENGVLGNSTDEALRNGGDGENGAWSEDDDELTGEDMLQRMAEAEEQEDEEEGERAEEVLKSSGRDTPQTSTPSKKVGPLPQLARLFPTPDDGSRKPADRQSLPPHSAASKTGNVSSSLSTPLLTRGTPPPPLNKKKSEVKSRTSPFVLKANLAAHSTRSRAAEATTVKNKASSVSRRSHHPLPSPSPFDPRPVRIQQPAPSRVLHSASKPAKHKTLTTSSGSRLPEVYRGEDDAASHHNTASGGGDGGNVNGDPFFDAEYDKLSITSPSIESLSSRISALEGEIVQHHQEQQGPAREGNAILGGEREEEEEWALQDEAAALHDEAAALWANVSQTDQEKAKLNITLAKTQLDKAKLELDKAKLEQLVSDMRRGMATVAAQQPAALPISSVPPPAPSMSQPQQEEQQPQGAGFFTPLVESAEHKVSLQSTSAIGADCGTGRAASAPPALKRVEEASRENAPRAIGATTTTAVVKPRLPPTAVSKVAISVLRDPADTVPLLPQSLSPSSASSSSIPAFSLLSETGDAKRTQSTKTVPAAPANKNALQTTFSSSPSLPPTIEKASLDAVLPPTTTSTTTTVKTGVATVDIPAVITADMPTRHTTSDSTSNPLPLVVATRSKSRSSSSPLLPHPPRLEATAKPPSTHYYTTLRTRPQRHTEPASRLPTRQVAFSSDTFHNDDDSYKEEDEEEEAGEVEDENYIYPDSRCDVNSDEAFSRVVALGSASHFSSDDEDGYYPQDTVDDYT